MTRSCHPMTYIEDNTPTEVDYDKQAILKRAEYMLLVSSKYPKENEALLGEFGMKRVLICHRELASADGDLELICGIIARYKRLQPYVIAYLLLKKRYTYTPYPFVNRNIRIALASGSALA